MEAPLPDMSGKVVVITGATRGIGRMAAHGIAPTGVEMILIGRSQERIDSVISELQQIEGCGPISGELCNLLLQSEIRDLSERINSKISRLDVLVNNAGAIFTKNIKTSEGFERTWALNHNSYYLLTTLLKDKLVETPGSRVVSTSSDAHQPAKMVWEDLQYEKRGTKQGWSSYCQSKLANILFTRELARRLAGTDTVANCIHPGFVNTGFSRNNGIFGKLLMALTWPFQRRDSRGAETIVWLATSEAAKKHNGVYLHDCKLKKITKEAKDMEGAAKLWQISEETTNTQGLW